MSASSTAMRFRYEASSVEIIGVIRVLLKFGQSRLAIRDTIKTVMLVFNCVNRQNRYAGVHEAIGKVRNPERPCAALRLREFARREAVRGAGHCARSQR